MKTVDQQLLERWYLHGDAGAFREITTRYAGLVFAAAKRVLKNAGDAEDVAQECFEALALRRDTAPVYLGAWLHAAATNRALNALDSAKRRRVREERAAADLPKVARPVWDDIYAHVDGAIAALPAEFRDAVVGHFLEGQSKADLARTLGVSRPTVHYRIDKGLEQVRGALRCQGVSTSAAALVSALGTEAVSAVPTGITASLGKIAVAGSPIAASGAVPATAALTTTIAGSVLMKKAAIIGAIVIAIVGGTGFVLSQRVATPPQGAPEAPVMAQTDTDALNTAEAPTDSSPPNALPEANETVDPPEPAPASETDNQQREEAQDWSNAGLGDLVIAGRVVDSRDQPVKGVFIQLLDSKGSAYTESGEDGSFQLNGLAPGEYGGHVSHDSYSDDRFSAQAGNEDVLIVLQGRTSVSGRVIDARTGSPVAQFRIAAQDGIAHKVEPGLFRDQQTVNDPRGWFSLDSVETGDSTLIVQAEGYAAAFTPIHLETDAAVRDVVIALELGRLAEGRVVDGKGTPAVGAWIFTRVPPPVADLKRVAAMEEERRSKSLSDVVAATAGEEGAFTLDTLEGTEEAVYAFHPELGSGKALLVWSGEGPLHGVEIVLENALGSANVLVTLDGEPAAGSPVFASAKGGMGTTFQQGTTGADGRATLADLPEGLLGITAIHPGKEGYARRIVAETPIEAGATATVTIDFTTASAQVNGLVHRGEQVPSGGRITLAVRNGAQVESYMGELNPDGGFAFESVTPGEASLQINAHFDDTPRVKAVPLSLVDGETLRLDIDLSGGGAIEGTATGIPPTNHATIVVLQGEHSVEQISIETIAALHEFAAGSAIVESDGTFSIEGISPGQCTVLLLVTKNRGPDAFDDARFATTAVDIVEGETLGIAFDMAE